MERASVTRSPSTTNNARGIRELKSSQSREPKSPAPVKSMGFTQKDQGISKMRQNRLRSNRAFAERRARARKEEGRPPDCLSGSGQRSGGSWSEVFVETEDLHPRSPEEIAEDERIRHDEVQEVLGLVKRLRPDVVTTTNSRRVIRYNNSIHLMTQAPVLMRGPDPLPTATSPTFHYVTKLIEDQHDEIMS
uniref:Uncharacterized protein n=1 Tax=Cannabis sativa TaxID=3483 RepID=A0A803QH65_CANSA